MINNIPQIQELKEFLTDNHQLQTKKIVYSWIQKRCSLLIDYFNQHYRQKDFRGFIYLLLQDKDPIIPVCPICGNNLPLRNFKKGFQITCCKECASKYYSKNTDVHNKISITQKSQQRCLEKWIYEYDVVTDSNNIIFRHYCKHGDIKVSKKVAYKMHDIQEGTYCIKCNEELFNNYRPSDIEVQVVINNFPEFYKQNSNALNWMFWMRYYPKMLKCLVCYFEKTQNRVFKKTILQEVYYVALHQLDKPLLCPICNTPITQFHKSTFQYATHCNKHLYGYNQSTSETEFINFIKSLGVQYQLNNRSILGKQEIDVLIPDTQIGFEFNGCYWHSTASKDKDYHIKKKTIALQNNIDIFFIWEDDWLYKRDIVESIIKAKLGIFQNRIYARQCIIQKVDYNLANTFLKNNCLYNNEYTKTLGLFYKEELVELLCIKNDIVVCVCSKLNMQIVGGCSKLFKYAQINGINYNADITKYNSIINQLGFNISNIKDDYLWYYTGKRRKDKPNNKAYKCYTSGIIEYKKSLVN